MVQAKILIVEDERIEAEAMSAVLSGMGYAVAGIAATGKAAIELATAHRPDVVLMDIRLRGPMDGISAAEEIRRQMDIPVIYLTAFADEQTLQRAKLSSPLGYLLKPAQGSEMRSAIEVALVIHQQTQRLADSEARYRGLFDGVPTGLFRTTVSGRILNANMALVRLLGYPDRETLLNAPVAATYANPADRDLLLSDLEASGGSAQRETPLRGYAGNVVWANVRVTSTSCPTGDEQCMEGSVEDITEDHARQQALRRSEEQNRLILNSTAEAILGLDLDGKCTFTNEAAVRMLGYQGPQDLLGKNLHDLLHHTRPNGTPFPSEECPRNVGIIKAAETHTENDLLWRSNGASFPAEVWTHPIVQDGQVAGSVLTFLDITERRQSQRELEAIASVATALRGAIQERDTLAIILDQLLAVFAAPGAAVIVRGQHANDLMVSMGAGDCSDLTGATWPAVAGAAYSVLEGGAAYAEGDLRTEVSATGGAATSLEAVVPASGAFLPLQAEGQTIGALWLGRGPTAEAASLRTPAEMRLLRSIADMAANALRRASLLESTGQSLRRVGALRAIDQAISGSLDLLVTLDVLLDQALGELGVDAAAVLLLHPGSQQLRQAAGRGFQGSPTRTAGPRMGEGRSGQAAVERRTLRWPGEERPLQIAPRDEYLRRQGFVSGYCAPITAKGTVIGVLEVLAKRPVRSDPEWMAFLEALARQAAIAIDSIRLFEDLQRSNLDLAVAYDSTLEGWSKAMDLRDRDTEGHTQRVTTLATRLARSLGISDQELAHFRRGALLHDIGKIGVPDSVLLKPGPLNDDEWAIMHQHPMLAFEMISPIAYLKRALDIPYCHHEHWDGTGYPRHLKAEQIPLAARIFAVVDVWDALTSDRPYRLAWTRERAMAHIAQQAGIQFDPKVVTAFLALLQEDGATE